MFHIKNRVMFEHSFKKNFVTSYSAKGIGLSSGMGSRGWGSVLAVSEEAGRHTEEIEDEEPYTFKSSSK